MAIEIKLELKMTIDGNEFFFEEITAANGHPPTVAQMILTGIEKTRERLRVQFDAKIAEMTRAV